MIDWPNIILVGREVNIKTAANRLFLIFVSHAGPFLPLRQGMRKNINNKTKNSLHALYIQNRLGKHAMD